MTAGQSPQPGPPDPRPLPPPSRYLLHPMMLEAPGVVRLWEDLERSGARPARPLVVSWIIGTECQLRCRHCWGRPRRMPPPSPRVRGRIVERLAEAGVCRVVLSGGEPTLVPELARYLRVLSEAGIPVSLYTNAIQPQGPGGDPSWLEAWNGEANIVQVSLDGGSPESFEAQRGRGTFARFLRGVELLRQAGARLLAHYVATPFNGADVHGAARLALALGCEGIIAELFYPAGRARAISRQHTVATAEAFNASAAALLRDPDLVGSALKLGLCFPVEVPFPDYVRAAIPPPPIPLRLPLNFARYSCVVDASGRVYPHSLLADGPAHACGSLLDTDLGSCWAEGAGFRLLPRERDLRGAMCASCEDYGFCRGGRAERAWELAGTFHTHDPHCHRASRARGAGAGPWRGRPRAAALASGSRRP